MLSEGYKTLTTHSNAPAGQKRITLLLQDIAIETTNRKHSRNSTAASEYLYHVITDLNAKFVVI